MTSQQPIIIFDYDFSPYAQKLRMAMALADVQCKRCDVPTVLPRPQLESMDITYRRIPVLAVGKDVYCDTAIQLAKVLELQGPKGKLHKHPADAAFEQWGNWAFQTGLTLAPASLLEPNFVKDRSTVFPILSRQDFAQLRPSGLGAFTNIMNTIENDFLSSGYAYVGGRNEPSTADVHVAWSIRWFLTMMGVEKEPGLGENDFPRTYAWFKSLPFPQPEALDAENSKETILKADYGSAELQNASNDALQQFKGKEVNVESADAVPGAHPQYGKLISSNVNEFSIELKNGLRLHFPRAGYYVKEHT